MNITWYDYESDDEAAQEKDILLADIEDYFYRIVEGLPSVYMSSETVSQLMDTTLANKIDNLNLNKMPVYQTEPNNSGNQKFTNPWMEEF